MNKAERYRAKTGSLNKIDVVMSREVDAYLDIIDARDKLIAELEAKLNPETPHSKPGGTLLGMSRYVGKAVANQIRVADIKEGLVWVLHDNPWIAIKAIDGNLVLYKKQVDREPKEPELIAEWSPFDFHIPESYPPKAQCYLCLTVFGEHIELCWNAISQRWMIPGSNMDEFNPLQIDYYMPLPMAPKKGDTKCTK